MTPLQAMADIAERAAAAERARAAATAEACTACGRLSRRQREVLVLLAKGLTTQQVAAALNIKPRTADAHSQRTLRKLGVHRAIEAAVIATKAGLV